MFGWSRLAAASASARNRARRRRLASCAGEDHLERDDAVQADLPGLVDDAHPAAGDLLQQLVVADRSPREERRGGGLFVRDGRGRGVGDTVMCHGRARGRRRGGALVVRGERECVARKWVGHAHRIAEKRSSRYCSPSRPGPASKKGTAFGLRFSVLSSSIATGTDVIDSRRMTSQQATTPTSSQDSQSLLSNLEWVGSQCDRVSEAVPCSARFEHSPQDSSLRPFGFPWRPSLASNRRILSQSTELRHPDGEPKRKFLDTDSTRN